MVRCARDSYFIFEKIVFNERCRGVNICIYKDTRAYNILEFNFYSFAGKYTILSLYFTYNK